MDSQKQICQKQIWHEHAKCIIKKLEFGIE